MKVQRIDHIGIIVNDLPAAKAFFLSLDLESLGRRKWKENGWNRLLGFLM